MKKPNQNFPNLVGIVRASSEKVLPEPGVGVRFGKRMGSGAVLSWYALGALYAGGLRLLLGSVLVFGSCSGARWVSPVIPAFIKQKCSTEPSSSVRWSCGFSMPLACPSNGISKHLSPLFKK